MASGELTTGTAIVSGEDDSCWGAPHDQQKFALALRISPQRRQFTDLTLVKFEKSRRGQLLVKPPYAAASRSAS